MSSGFYSKAGGCTYPNIRRDESDQFLRSSHKDAQWGVGFDARGNTRSLRKHTRINRRRAVGEMGYTDQSGSRSHPCDVRLDVLPVQPVQDFLSRPLRLSKRYTESHRRLERQHCASSFSARLARGADFSRRGSLRDSSPAVYG